MIPLPQIADRAEELDRLLREISNQLITKVELLELQTKAEEQAAEIRRRSLQTRDLLAGNPTSLDLEDEQRYWRSLSLEYVAERRFLTLRAGSLEDQIQTLEAQQPEWVATWIQVHKSPGIEAIVERIKQQLDKIETAKSQTQEQLNVVLSVQNQVSQQDQQISDILLRVRQARERERGRLLELNGQPLWKGSNSVETLGQTIGPTFHRSFDRSLASAKEFVGAHILATMGLAMVYLLALLGVFKFRRYVASAAQPDVSTEALQVLDRPFSVALLVALIGTVQYAASAPTGIAFVFYLLCLVPVLRLLAPLTEPKLRVFLYVLATFYALCSVYLLIQLPPFFRRVLYALLVLAALVSFAWLTRPSKIGPLLSHSRKVRILLIGIRVGLVLLAVSLAANVIGFVSLAQVLGISALVGTFVAAAFSCVARVLTLILSTMLHTDWARTLLERRTDVVERWGGRLLSLAASLLWLRAMLRLFTIYEGVMGALSNLFQRPIGFGRVYFTLGSVLSVLLILLLGYSLANAFTFLLKKVVLPKLPLSRGVPYAISTIAYYVLLLLVAVAALSAAGVEMNKFTVLTGALGVGLGFGLQNIVNNFVSGLILIFERPIHVGDTVEVGGLVGMVRRIGARSSTILTYQGAEVIVPNSNLISNQVINWTLSSQWRRVDVPVGVAYGTDPERVIKLLVGVAESHPGVLLARPPMAFFLGFGESALKFELRFWSAQQDTWFQLQSDVTVAVARALREASIEIPLPQRDLHVRSIDASVAESVASSAVRLTSSADATERSVRA
ncbi:MAG TPA: mechanosensitive ion channel domain-containing protein [Candidatus Sulfotelmatobacter sp.]|nr:mechanosensitive ion channel domain-containing protein [Candidatus Sulfotelmatobacter sp.]